MDLLFEFIIDLLVSSSIEGSKSNKIPKPIRYLLLGIVIFFIPSIIYAVFTSFVYFNFVSDEYEKCAKCIFHPLDDSKCVVDETKGMTTSTTTTTAQAGNSIKGAVTTQVTQQLSPGILLVDPDNQ